MSRKRSKALPVGDISNSPCPHFPSCGGCTYLGLSLEEALSLKEARVREILHAAAPDDDFTFEGITSSPLSFEYRNKMEFSFGDALKEGPLTLGMHERGSFFNVVSVPDCRIIDEDFRTVLRTTLSFFAPLYEEGKVRYFHKKRQTGYLRHLLVRKGYHTGELLVDLVTTSRNPDAPMEETAMRRAYTEALQSQTYRGKLVGLLHTVNDAVADAVKDGGTEVLYGQDSITDGILGLTFKITPFSFFQTNTASAEVLYGIVRRYVKEALAESGAQGTGILYDLYCGTGTIAQLMADVAKEVTGVELVEEAVEAARENARRNGLNNCTFLAGDVLQVLDDLTTPPDFLILDPPRDGVNVKALRKIVSYGTPHIVYVSCKPESLLKDLPVLHEAGYRVRKAVCLDQFPWTKNIEAVIRLSL